MTHVQLIKITAESISRELIASIKKKLNWFYFFKQRFALELFSGGSQSDYIFLQLYNY